MAALVAFSLIVAALSLAAHYAVGRIQKHIEARGFWPARFDLVRRFFLPVQVSLIATGLLFFVINRPEVEPYAESARLVVRIILIVALVVLATRAVDVFFRVYNERIHCDHPDDLKQRRLKTRLQFLERFIDLFLIVIAIGLILVNFESFRKYGNRILASAGLASVIIGFAAQRSLANLIAGFQIAFTQPIRLGDAVVVENEWGWIEEIHLTYVVVKIWDLRRLVLPINYFLEKPFQNWTRTTASIIGSVEIHADYSLPVDTLRWELTKILQASPLWDGHTNVLQVTNSSGDGIVVRALVSAKDSPSTWDLRCEVREKLVRYVQESHPDCLPKKRLNLGREPKQAFPELHEHARALDSRREHHV